MPYKDPEKKRAYMAAWAARRRREWLAEQVCHRCGRPGPDDMTVIGSKLEGGGAWTGSAERRDRMLASATVICNPCIAAARSAGTPVASVARRSRKAPTPRATPKPTPKSTPKLERSPKVPSRAERSGPKRPAPVLSEVLLEDDRRAARRAWREDRRRSLGYAAPD